MMTICDDDDNVMGRYIITLYTSKPFRHSRLSLIACARARARVFVSVGHISQVATFDNVVFSCFAFQ